MSKQIDVDGVFHLGAGNKNPDFFVDLKSVVGFIEWTDGSEIGTGRMYGDHPVEEKRTLRFGPIEGGILDLFKQQGINHGDRCRVTFERKMRGGVPTLSVKSVVKL